MIHALKQRMQYGNLRSHYPRMIIPAAKDTACSALSNQDSAQLDAMTNTPFSTGSCLTLGRVCCHIPVTPSCLPCCAVSTADLQRATHGLDVASAGTNNLNRMLQLTGLSDPVYAEAYVTVHQYDIVLDVTVINRSAETLQNLCLELATMGDLKLVERPQVR